METDVGGSRSFSEGDLDAAAIRKRYEQERQRRLRPEGVEQYLEPTGDLARFSEDPFAGLAMDRHRQIRNVDAVVVGGGFGGLLAAVRLAQIGVSETCIIDKAADFGGTWYWNRYPGAACDVEALIYMPLLEDLGYLPTRKYAQADELFAHAQAIGRKYDLYRKALFQTDVHSLDWREEEGFWTVSTKRGDTLNARYVILTTGVLSRPKLPSIVGIERFKGWTFHTSRWRYDRTGGSLTGKLERLRDQRVGLVGTGATAVQCAPHLAKWAEHLYVFQRTPSSVDLRETSSPLWDPTTATPGWQTRRMENFTNLTSGVAQSEDLVGDAWTDVWKLVRPDGLAADPAAELDRVDLVKMEQIRSRVSSVVHDPVTAAALKPWYKRLCKRPCFHDDYLAMFNRPNVTLVDTQGRGPDAITDRGVRVADLEYDLDGLIFATGFEVGTEYERRAGIEIRGRNSLTLTQKWSSGAQTLHGLMTRGFPNCFIVNTTQAALAVNNTHLLGEQARHIAHIVEECRARHVKAVEPGHDAELEWTAAIVQAAKARRAYQTDCTPSYYNAEGRLSDSTFPNGVYGGGAASFISILQSWRAAGDFAGLEFVGDQSS